MTVAIMVVRTCSCRSSYDRLADPCGPTTAAAGGTVDCGRSGCTTTVLALGVHPTVTDDTLKLPSTSGAVAVWIDLRAHGGSPSSGESVTTGVRLRFFCVPSTTANVGLGWPTEVPLVAVADFDEVMHSLLFVRLRPVRDTCVLSKAFEAASGLGVAFALPFFPRLFLYVPSSSSLD